MPRGGARPGAGRPRIHPPKPPKVAPAADLPRSYTEQGKKAPDAPQTWPFGTVEPPAPEKASEVPAAAPGDPDQPVITGDTPLEFLLAVVRSQAVKLPVRMQAAAIAAPFVHAKPAPMGKKEERAGAAKVAGKGRFAAAPTPLQLVKR